MIERRGQGEAGSLREVEWEAKREVVHWLVEFIAKREVQDRGERGRPQDGPKIRRRARGEGGTDGDRLVEVSMEFLISCGGNGIGGEGDEVV